MKSIVFFNNKGGVGKTTLACNIVSFLNTNKNKRVLLIDADPQCNATQAILSDDLCESIYLEQSTNVDTLYTSLKPFEDGEASIETNITPMLGTKNRFGTDLIPGHPKMSVIEDNLSDAWSELRGRQTRGYRMTNWCHQLMKSFEDQYDYIVFDVGPSLGALNRSVILACDFVVTPFGCDIFSLLGIQNIAGWISTWKSQYDSSINEAVSQDPTVIDRYQIIHDTSKKYRFAGYSVQQYVTRKFKEGPRPVKSYDKIMKEIPETVSSAMEFLYPNNFKPANAELGHIPYLYSLIPMAQSSKSPIHKLERGDGVTGSQYAQVTAYSELMDEICTRLLDTLEGSDD
ncbi:helicase DnaB [Pseudoalteromonas sp. S3776]|uniref:ParA family protein n=1 Tax=Pseudoalteromonas sp. S3776 TaxID=579544 RepID=UPI00110985BC|nr:AAA family ATPase [Pseudoalteromonas sp. S3776]TMO80053.1 helicase DnaB [Pseudoalteromonas sp. S3776]